jgi:4-hydroxy-3-polyprenylbenzoate decarboxylase
MAGSLANSISRGLAQRVGDVALKQRWPLLLAIRETPMSPILLKNLLELARAGAHIVPPLPAFYLGPDETSAYPVFIDHFCMRLLDLLGIESDTDGLRWKA